MVLLPDSEAIYHEWRRLVVAHVISGVQVHDARLAAAMRVHSVTHILNGVLRRNYLASRTLEREVADGKWQPAMPSRLRPTLPRAPTTPDTDAKPQDAEGGGAVPQ